MLFAPPDSSTDRGHGEHISCGAKSPDSVRNEMADPPSHGLKSTHTYVVSVNQVFLMLSLVQLTA